VNAFVWLVPTAMLLKVRVEGLGVICAAAKAFGVKKRIAEKKTNKRNPQEISLQQGEFFTAQPLCAARELRGGGYEAATTVTRLLYWGMQHIQFAANYQASTDHRGS